MTFVNITSAPSCPNCGKRMGKHKTMGGEYWYCPDYAYDGGIIEDINYNDYGQVDFEDHEIDETEKQYKKLNKELEDTKC